MMISQKGYQALQAHSESYIRHAGLGRDGLPAVWVCILCSFADLLKGLQRPMAEEMGADFPPQTIHPTGMRNAAVVASLFFGIGSEEEGAWEEEWMSNVSDAVVVVGVVVRRRDSRKEACLNLVNNGTPRSVALKGR